VGVGVTVAGVAGDPLDGGTGAATRVSGGAGDALARLESGDAAKPVSTFDAGVRPHATSVTMRAR
jgi:hypothetical protein